MPNAGIKVGTCTLKQVSKNECICAVFTESKKVDYA